MTVKVNSETMTLKIMNCDAFEGAVLGTAHNKEIEVILVDSSTEEDVKNDLAQAEKERVLKHPKADITLNLNDLLFPKVGKKL